MNNELKLKIERLRLMMAAGNFGAVHMASLGNLSWILCGADLVVSFIDAPVAEVIVTPKEITVVASNIEQPRLEAEELPEGVSLIYVPWFDETAKHKVIADLIGEAKVLSDTLGRGYLYKDFWPLRVPLLAEEIKRYRVLAADTSEVFTDVLSTLKAGITESEVAGRLLEGLAAKGLQSVVTLVAGDERLERFKHPLPKNVRVQDRLMAVACARKFGLIASITRFVSFGGESQEKKKAYQQLLSIEASILDATQHGILIKDAFTELKHGYAKADKNNAWKAHHQGGPCGYYTRDFMAQPLDERMIHDGSAYAWNPSLTGVKVEDTVLLLEDKLEILTQDKRWPLKEVSGRLRPEVLEL